MGQRIGASDQKGLILESVFLNQRGENRNSRMITT